MSQAGLNRVWSQAILETIATAGVKHICIAPGSRSTPLSLEALELAERSGVTIHTHFDERGLGFLALGLAKATQQPVAIIVTSGTAVANLLPSTAESGLTGEKLVLLTADRPLSLVGVGANQAIVQKGIFSSHVRKSVLLPSPSRQASLSEELTPIKQGLAYQSLVGGALHINCPFPEPLYIQSDTEKDPYLTQLNLTELTGATKATSDVADLAKLYPSYNVPELTNSLQQGLVNQLPTLKTVVVIGKMPLSDAQNVQQWAQQMGWPILADPQSGVSSEWAHFDLWLQHPHYFNALSQAQCILQFGARIVSKRLAQWTKQVVTERNCHYWLFEPTASVLNPDRLPQLRTVASIPDCISLLSSMINAPANTSNWAETLKPASKEVEHCAMAIKRDNVLTECQLALRIDELVELMPNRELFVGNSLIVRLLDMLSKFENVNVHTNRGASGIDGLVATAAGVQRAQQSSMLTLIGDTSLLYDVNSLALLTRNNQPHVVIVTNNDGGAIFDLLPVPERQKQALYQMPHGYQFEFAAKQFGLHYTNPGCWLECREAIEDYLVCFGNGETQSALLVEISSPPEQASQQIKTITQAMKSHVV
ncbi:2-succinyl-5-enolpyruvyl-6-hydroxy-3-cyclohexene-1-carboxylic-acid synthase [Vibrio gangliei]|uniref:2-succinyl-5-enolpyruvyl-6-hydroxy-3- cyclohexene-1-carboxylic-acid synthase n=1 Tax=Vibrio gangliei TaxID=2077090 RepID=UPI000D021DD8|nr:2-succinyl-5-enolpyruvyl-6-hydroxy-3-cyclohexene-1-carboxylic-acid synthase [Vibrio gangliei]